MKQKRSANITDCIALGLSVGMLAQVIVAVARVFAYGDSTTIFSWWQIVAIVGGISGIAYLFTGEL